MSLCLKGEGVTESDGVFITLLYRESSYIEKCSKLRHQRHSVTFSYDVLRKSNLGL